MPRLSRPDFSDGRLRGRAGARATDIGSAHFEHGAMVVRGRVALSSSDERAVRAALDRRVAGNQVAMLEDSAHASVAQVDAAERDAQQAGHAEGARHARARVHAVVARRRAEPALSAAITTPAAAGRRAGVQAR